MSIRQDLQDYISDNGLSQSAVARAVGVTSPVVNQYLHGKYPGNVQEIERKIAAYLQKQREREIHAGNPAVYSVLHRNRAEALLRNRDGQYRPSLPDARGD